MVERKTMEPNVLLAVVIILDQLTQKLLIQTVRLDLAFPKKLMLVNFLCNLAKDLDRLKSLNSLDCKNHKNSPI